jgi:hypothetical protein
MINWTYIAQIAKGWFRGTGQLKPVSLSVAPAPASRRGLFFCPARDGWSQAVMFPGGFSRAAMMRLAHSAARSTSPSSSGPFVSAT